MRQHFAQLLGERKNTEAIQACEKADATERQALLAKPLSSLGSSLHAGDAALVRVINTLGAHFDTAPSIAPSASSVTREYPASNG
ncbi:hypothetical protein [Novosphingobium sp.]|uniref:hypothetical protein n=1 Tax=Novosphingobium sp. TaxID=1874826 RepID=UPI002FDCDFA0